MARDIGAEQVEDRDIGATQSEATGGGEEEGGFNAALFIVNNQLIGS